jgi:hypothetical protein
MPLRRVVRAAVVAALVSLPILLSSSASVGTARLSAGSPVVISEAHHDVSPPLRSIPPAAPLARTGDEVENAIPHPSGATGGPDLALQPPLTSLPPGMPGTIANFAGAQNSDNAFLVFPPDTNGDVGPNNYVQMVNLTFTIFSKTGTRLLGPLATNTLWSGFGGLCQSNNDGDPIVLYDRIADRWLLSQFAIGSSSTHQCIAISQTGDPTGAWYRYDFPYSTTLINDYPKFGVWPDAYYLSANQFTLSTQTFQGTGVVAYERAQMLQGLPARAIYFDLGASGSTSSFSSWLPADLDSSVLPPAGAPNHYLTIQGTSLGDPADRLQQWDFHVDWTTPASSTFTQKAVLPVAGFNANLCNFARSCLPQPGTTAKLDALSSRLMFRNAYRNFGTYEAEVVNHTVNVGSNRAGIRWYEVRNTSTTPTIFQQGTYAGDTANTESRWMGSAALDKSGDIALGYSDASSTVFPSIRYVGRLIGDPLGTLPQGEATLIAGAGSQTTSNSRWGDYSMLAVDPADDCTFWYTQEYYAATGLNWQTRVGSFKFPSCGVTGSIGPTTPVLDDFNRANGGAGPNWALLKPSGFAAMNVSGNAAVDSSSSLFAWNYWNAASFGPDCEAYVTIASYGANESIRVGARVTGAGTASPSGYFVQVGSTGAWSILRIDNGGGSNTLASGVTQALASGDKVAIRIVGSVVTALHFTSGGGWVQVLSHDTSGDSVRYSAAGRLALEFKTSTLDDFGGGTLGANSAPVNTAPPTISGSAVQGQTLTASPGTWSGTPAPTFTYQWQRCDSGGGNCVAILGATSPTYMLGVSDVGSTIRVVVTGTNSVGSAAASSAATAVVVAGSIAPTTPVLDDFNRANGGAGPNWALLKPTGFATMNVSGNAAVDSSSSLFAWDYWNAASFGPDCEAYVTIASYGANESIRVGARVTGAGTASPSGYYVSVGSTGAWSILRIDNGGGSNTLASGVAQALASGDKVAIRIVGSVVAALHFTSGGGWVQVLSHDTSGDSVRYTAAGRLALEFKTSTLDDFGGGTLP